VPRLTKIYTRTGDDGSTALGQGQRVAKDAVRVEAYGAVDELNSALGVAAALSLSGSLSPSVARIQNELFHLGSDLCLPEDGQQRRGGPRIEERHVEALESEMDRLSDNLQPLENFVLPGGHPAAAQLHVARAVCRRAERWVVKLSRQESVNPAALRYLNRLSDALFVFARVENAARGATDVLWNSRA
jgi:cob(I)alamin adenosyltransferase